jgi:GntR family transcriptional repressor for pyruvate dehydrogenase complex
LRATIPGEPLLLGPHKQFVYNADFHTLVIEMCGNALLLIAAQPIFEVLQTRLSRSQLGRPFHRAINQHHREIADAIAGGDERAAAARMHEHLEFLQPYYERAWREVLR